MAKKIISPAPQEYKTTCRECGTTFTYELKDIIKNHVGLPRRFVVCANDNCGARCAHFDQT